MAVAHWYQPGFTLVADFLAILSFQTSLELDLLEGNQYVQLSYSRRIQRTYDS